MCECQKYLEPNAKLQKMMTLLIVMAVINLILAILRAVFFGFAFVFNDFLGCLMLFLAIQTVLYMYVTIYLFFSLINSFVCFITIGIVIQQLITGGEMPFGSSTDDDWRFGITLFAFVYYLVAVIFIFPIYKEMKAQLYELAVSDLNRDQEEGNNYNPPSNNNNNVSNNQVNNNNDSDAEAIRNHNFVAFSGRGQVVGGN